MDFVAEKSIIHHPKTRLNKFLINWKLILNNAEMEKISMRPEVLQKGLIYVRNAAKRSTLEIYRIAEMDEITHFARPSLESASKPRHPHGIAIIEAPSIEEARRLVNQWVEGFGFGGVSVENYIEFDINPLVDVVTGGKE